MHAACGADFSHPFVIPNTFSITSGPVNLCIIFSSSSSLVRAVGVADFSQVLLSLGLGFHPALRHETSMALLSKANARDRSCKCTSFKTKAF
jgi:hypothetical protein